MKPRAIVDMPALFKTKMGYPPACCRDDLLERGQQERVTMISTEPKIIFNHLEATMCDPLWLILCAGAGIEKKSEGISLDKNLP